MVSGATLGIVDPVRAKVGQAGSGVLFVELENFEIGKCEVHLISAYRRQKWSPKNNANIHLEDGNNYHFSRCGNSFF